MRHCANLRVLHLGCIGLTDAGRDEKIRFSKDSLHARLTSVAKECVGVDLDADTVRALSEEGLFRNIVPGNAESLEACALTGKFDVVVVGDLIEHLSNPGLILDGIRRWIKPGGLLVLSTPNAFGLLSQLRYWLGSFREGAQHVLAFNVQGLAQLLERHGWELVSSGSCSQTHAYKKRWLFELGARFFALAPSLAGTMLFISKPQGGEGWQSSHFA